MDIDPNTIATGVGLAVLGSRDLLNKLLGPSAEYVGGEVKGLVQKCNVNLDRIFVKAKDKLGSRLDAAGGVNPRILKHVIDEGRFCEDELTAEYYGGVLASSKSENGRDDRGVTLLATIKSLSVYQLRFHYVFYRLVNNLFKVAPANLADVNDCENLKLFIPLRVYEVAMDFQPCENSSAILAHIMFGLRRHDLIRESFAFGSSSHLQKDVHEVDTSGILVAPSLLGAELFLWALGIQGSSGRELLQVETGSLIDGVKLIDGAVSVDKLRGIERFPKREVIQ